MSAPDDLHINERAKGRDGFCSAFILPQFLYLGSGFGLSIGQLGRHAFGFASAMPLGTALADYRISGSPKFANKEDAVTVFVSVEALLPADIDRRSSLIAGSSQLGARNLRSRKRYGEPK
jgi:hypothetical protein